MDAYILMSFGGNKMKVTWRKFNTSMIGCIIICSFLLLAGFPSGIFAQTGCTNDFDCDGFTDAEEQNGIYLYNGDFFSDIKSSIINNNIAGIKK